MISRELQPPALRARPTLTPTLSHEYAGEGAGVLSHEYAGEGAGMLSHEYAGEGAGMLSHEYAGEGWGEGRPAGPAEHRCKSSWF